MNVGLKIVKCSKKEYEGAEWEEIHLASINSDQFNIVHKGSALFTIYPYRTMYGRDATQIWGTFKRSVLAEDFADSQEIISTYGDIEIAFKQNCFLEEGQSIVDTSILDSIIND